MSSRLRATSSWSRSDAARLVRPLGRRYADDSPERIAPMACPRRCTWTLVLLLAPALAAQAAPASSGADAPALFATNCAKCHGLDGSGTGPAVLDRPARNFKEGGFSFGNTAETIARTIAYG